MASSRWSCAILVVALFITATTIPVAQAQAPDAAEWLTAHNSARSAEGVGLPSLTWSNSAYLFAVSWAQNRATTDGCPLEHSGSETYGENIAWYGDTTTTPTTVVGSWVAEKANYDYASDSCTTNKMCGHYTQVVWKATTSVGCASALCTGPSGSPRKFFTCNYYPRGNMDDERPY